MSSTFKKEETSDMDVHVEPEAEITGTGDAIDDEVYLLKQSGCAAVPSIKQLKGFKLPGLQPPQQVRNPTHHISFTILINCSASQQNVSCVI